MYELAEIQTRAVSGGYAFYVTQQWKDQEAFISGLGGAVLCGVFGGILGWGLAGLMTNGGGKEMLSGALAGFAVAGLGGYKLGEWLSWMENGHLQNNTWYDFVTVYY